MKILPVTISISYAFGSILVAILKKIHGANLFR